MTKQDPAESLADLVEAPGTGLRARFAMIGNLAVVGSYDLDLIANGNPEPDVDMNCLVDSSADMAELATSIGLSFVRDSRQPWHKFEVYDNRKAARLTMPKSLYLGLKAYVPGGKVTADTWFFNNPQDFDNANRNHQNIKSQLDEDRRASILRIKDEAQTMHMHIPGFAIYRAVIENNVSSLDEFTNQDKATLEELNRYLAD